MDATNLSGTSTHIKRVSFCQRIENPKEISFMTVKILQANVSNSNFSDVYFQIAIK